MNDFKPTEAQENHFIWKSPLPCVIDFGHDLRRMGLNKVVDIGCRVGGNVIALSKMGLQAMALDKSMENLLIADGRAKAEYCDIQTIHQTNPVTIPFEDEAIHAFITSTAIHHSVPEESQKLINEVYRTLAPGGRVLAAVLSTEDYRYGTGKEIATNTFENTVGPELKNIHQFFTEKTLLSLFSSFILECKPFIVPSTYILDAPDGQKQGTLLVGRFLKGATQNINKMANTQLSDCLRSANRSVELLVSCHNIKENELISSCLEYLEKLSTDILDKVYCQCIIVGNSPIETVPILETLNKFKGHKHFSLAYSEQTSEAQSLNIAIVDGIIAYASTHTDSVSDYMMPSQDPHFINLLRQQLTACWKKATVLYDNGKVLRSNTSLSDSTNTHIINAKPNIRTIDFRKRAKEHIRVGITQINLNGILDIKEAQLLKPNMSVLSNTIEQVLSRAKPLDLDLLLLPELSGDESLNMRLQAVANANNMVIVGGSYYDERRVNCCPVAIPGNCKPYIVEKVNRSPYEISPNKNAGCTEGSEIIIFKNTVAGSFGVLICADFLNDALVESIYNQDIDFLCVSSMNNDSSRFMKKMNLKCQNYNRGIYFLYSNCLFSMDDMIKTDGLSSLFGFMDKLFLKKLEKTDDEYPYKIISFSEENAEGLIVADINIFERRPSHISPESKPNISDVEKIAFDQTLSGGETKQN